MEWTVKRFLATANNIRELRSRERIEDMEDLRSSVATLLGNNSNSYALYRRAVMRLPKPKHYDRLVSNGKPPTSAGG